MPKKRPNPGAKNLRKKFARPPLKKPAKLGKLSPREKEIFERGRARGRMDGLGTGVLLGALFRLAFGGQLDRFAFGEFSGYTKPKGETASDQPTKTGRDDRPPTE